MCEIGYTDYTLTDMKRYQFAFNTLTLFLTCFALLSYFPLRRIHRLYNVYKNNKYQTPSVQHQPSPEKKTAPTSLISREEHRITRNLHAKYPVTEKKPFVIVIASYNNETYCEKNLLSVFDQTYKNYRVIYIDDCSTDKTFEKVEKFVKDRGLEDKVTLIHNTERRLKLANLYKAYISCRNDEIIVCLDGDDWLAHENVLKEVNHYYQNPDVWLTYSMAINHPKYEKKDGSCITDKDLINNNIRDIPFCISMLRTFYASLFKMIKLKDLLYKGKFLPSADDFAFMIPMIEMAPTHTLFIPEVQYVINDSNPIREHHVISNLQVKLMKHIKKLEKYKPLDDSFHPTNIALPQVKTSMDLIVISNDSPKFLTTALQNYKLNFSPLHTIYVLFKASSPEIQREYDKLIASFPTVTFIKEGELSFKNLIEKSTFYVAVATDDFQLKHPVNTLDCIKDLELTQSVNFLIDHPNFSSPPLKINESLRAISLANAIKDPELFGDSFFSIFQKKFILDNLPDKKSSENLLNLLCLKEQSLSETALFLDEPLTIPLHSEF